MFNLYQDMSQRRQLMLCACLESIFLLCQPAYFIPLSSWLALEKDKRNHCLHRQACLVSFGATNILGRTRRRAGCSEVGQEAMMATNPHRVGCGVHFFSCFVTRLTNSEVWVVWAAWLLTSQCEQLRPSLAEKSFSCCKVSFVDKWLVFKVNSQVLFSTGERGSLNCLNWSSTIAFMRTVATCSLLLSFVQSDIGPSVRYVIVICWTNKMCKRGNIPNQILCIGYWHLKCLWILWVVCVEAGVQILMLFPKKQFCLHPFGQVSLLETGNRDGSRNQ